MGTRLCACVLQRPGAACGCVITVCVYSHADSPTEQTGATSTLYPTTLGLADRQHIFYLPVSVQLSYGYGYLKTTRNGYGFFSFDTSTL